MFFLLPNEALSGSVLHLEHPAHPVKQLLKKKQSMKSVQCTPLLSEPSFALGCDTNINYFGILNLKKKDGPE